MKRSVITILLLISLFSSNAAAGIDEAIAEILRSNSSLASRAASFEAALNEERSANVLSGPEVEFEYKWGRYENKWGLSAAQSFEWPGVYSARRKASSERALAYEMLLRSEACAIALEARKTLLELARTRSEWQTASEACRNLGRLAEVSRTAFDRGEITVIELRNIEFRVFDLENMKASLESSISAIEARLAALNNGQPVTVDFGGDIPLGDLLPEAAYREDMELNDPAIAANLHLGAAARADISAAGRAALPSLKIGYVHENEGPEGFDGLLVGIELPLWSRAASLRKARTAETAARLEGIDYTVRRLAELTSDYAEATRLSARVKAAERLFVANDYPALLGRALDEGIITIDSYLTDYNNYLASLTAYRDLRYNLAISLASLNRYRLP